ncbi:Indoleamine 2,3-dioxygenase [Coprinopsis marcescibilis]|uniref:Indoleamine 2,3-dioxygenase n=1 Tax=Coprinopsis marcescibilis TaxID=230819 RepID=A0A5C3LBN2_COPMA|nr:Indoleamine 2,3-dioxygenase [Coprinopsis marcescibilis]
MDILPSPPLFFTQLVHVALSVLKSRHQIRRSDLARRRSAYSYDIHQQTGFFPPEPLPKLPPVFAQWEEALRDANGKLSLGELNECGDETLEGCPDSKAWRARIEGWSVISIEPLHNDLRLLQRAHLVLAWLVSFYVHSMPPSNKAPLVPASLAVPLVQVSRHLGMAPILTFADTVLWNWELKRPDQPLSSDNIQFINTFSGTEDERNFYYASALAELRGVEILRIIDDFNNLPGPGDLPSITKISRDLARLTIAIEDIKEIINSVRSVCDPHVFYWEIRPWFEGSGAKGPDDPGWIYQGVDETEPLDLSGPSAGQSSVMHALDIFLHIDHKLQERRSPAPSSENKRADHGFMERMRRYMPGQHREFLELLQSSLSIRYVARSTPSLRDAYDSAVAALRKLRDNHIRIACLYVVSMSRTTPIHLAAASECPVAAQIARQQDMRRSEGPARGTGGNELAILLKAGRDATRRAILKG